jgi:hypothetical protein
MKHEDVMQLSAELFIEHSFLNIRWQPRIDKDDLADIECDIVTIIDCTYVVHTVDAFLRRYVHTTYSFRSVFDYTYGRHLLLCLLDGCTARGLQLERDTSLSTSPSLL